MKACRPEIELTTDLMAWWTDNDDACDFCISTGDEIGLSLNLSYLEAKQLFDVLKKKLNRS